MKIKIRFQDDSDGYGWNAWVSDCRCWQPVIGFQDPCDPPTLEDVCNCYLLTILNPDDFDGVLEV